MRKEAFLVLSLFLMIFMIGSVSANDLIQTNGIWIQQLFINGGTNCRSLYAVGTSAYPDESHLVTFNFKDFQSPLCVLGSNAFLMNPIKLEIDNKTFTAYDNDIIITVHTDFTSPASIFNSSVMNLHGIFYSNDASFFIGSIQIVFTIEDKPNSNYGHIFVKGMIVPNQAQNNNLELTNRVSALESWKQTIEDWKTTITDTIAQIWLTITGHTTRIEALENSTCTSCGNASSSGYIKYLSYSDRKKMVCGYAIDNHLTSLVDLKANCTIRYAQYTSGERSYCSCKEIK